MGTGAGREGEDARANAGRIADIGYTAGFFRETAPSHLAFAALLAGYSPERAWHPRRVLELGFGQGFGLALLAAANPDVAFEGCDFDAEHVANARALARQAGLSNVVLAQTSFEDFAQQGGEPDADVIALHGVLSWIAPAAQDAIGEIVRTRLAHGGFLYVSYNCLPGWAPLAPIRQVVMEVKRRTGGGSERQLDAAIETLHEMRRRNALYFAANPIAAGHFDGMLAMDRRYLVHEYLSEHWRPLDFSEVAARFADMGLSYIGSATLTENLDQCSVPPGVLPLLTVTEDPLLRESLRDFAGNKQFRRDIFVRTPSLLSPDERRRTLSRLGFMLAVPRTRILFQFPSALGVLAGTPDVYGPLADLLLQGLTRFDEIAALPAFEDRPGLALECLTLLVHSGQVLPVLPPEPADAISAQRFNRVIVAKALAGDVRDSLASPVTRTGVAVTDFDLLALAALFDGKGESATTAAAHGLSIIEALGRQPRQDGRCLAGEEAVRFLAGHMNPILDESVPIWRGLGII